MQVLNIRGTTCSGKTTLMKQIIAQDKPKIISLTKEVKGTLLDKLQSVVIGTYKKSGKFGGCDSVKKVEHMEQAIWKALSIRPHVLFEGLLVSHSYARWKNFSDQLKILQVAHKSPSAQGMIWAFVNPTFKQNLNQLKQRNAIKNLREERGDKFVMNFIQRYKSICRLEKKALADNQTVIYPRHDEYPWDYVLNYLDITGDQILLKPNKKMGIGKFLR